MSECEHNAKRRESRKARDALRSVIALLQFLLEMPEEEVSYPLIGQSFLDQEASQRVVQVHLILQYLENWLRVRVRVRG